MAIGTICQNEWRYFVMKLMKKFLLLCLFGISISCGKEVAVNGEKTNPRPSFPFILKCDGLDAFLTQRYVENELELPYGNYLFFYAGPVRDTITIYPIRSVEKSSLHQDTLSGIRGILSGIDNPYCRRSYSFTFEERMKLPDYRNRDLSISFDTSQRIGAHFPVMVSNYGHERVVLSDGAYLPMYLEALDSMQRWKPIEGYSWRSCGGDYNVLNSGHCIITLAPRFSGAYQTSFRFRVGHNISQVFYGNMDYRQFEFGINTNPYALPIELLPELKLDDQDTNALKLFWSKRLHPFVEKDLRILEQMIYFPLDGNWPKSQGLHEPNYTISKSEFFELFDALFPTEFRKRLSVLNYRALQLHRNNQGAYHLDVRVDYEKQEKHSAILRFEVIEGTWMLTSLDIA